MRPEFDREIDSLLRRNVARGPKPGGAAGARALHLDADELSAFLENSLPAAARASYAAHLADCDECRGHVVVLARAADASDEFGASAAVPRKEVSKASGWRAWLAAPFAPQAVRYAAPVLALCLVGVVTFIALRSRGGEPLLTERRMEETPAPAGRTSEESLRAPGEGGGGVNANLGVTTGEATAPSAGAPAEMRTANQSQSGTAARADAAAEPAVASPQSAENVGAAASGRSDDAARLRERQAADLERRQAQPDDSPLRMRPPPSPAEVARESAKRAEPAESARATAAAPAAGGSGSGVAPPPPPSAPAQRSEARRRSAGELRADEDEAARLEETRTVAGHRFRRQGGAWVDVRYAPSMPTTGVRRGTESFRALVADIPALGRIAEQLEGEVVVVVSGRAYRIRP